MKIAIPIWNDKISPVLDTALRLLIVELDGGREVSRVEIFLDEQDLSRKCLRIQRLGIDVLICGAISRTFSRTLMGSGVNIIPGISGPAEDVLQASLDGTLSQSRFLMPGCRGEALRAHCDALDVIKSADQGDNRKQTKDLAKKILE